MMKSSAEIINLLQGTFLEGKEVRQLPIDESSEIAFCLEISEEQGIEAWQLFRSIVAQTGCYPILTDYGNYTDYFSRFYYLEEQQEGKLQSVVPESIVETFTTDDLIASFLEKQENCGEVEHLLEWKLERDLKDLRTNFGYSPEESEIRALIEDGTIQSWKELEHYLFNWELCNLQGLERLSKPDLSYLRWYPPEGPFILLLLPIQNGWEALAYLYWFAASCGGDCGTRVAMQLLKKWHEQYEAELVGHFGTMLNFTVAKPPNTPESSFELAWEQTAIAECTITLSGVSLRDHTRSLLVADRWFLHQRP